MALTDAQLADYRRDGFVVCENFVEPATCDRLCHRMTTLVRDFDPAGVSTVFSTTAQSHARDDYFLESGDEIRFFFEEEAFDAAGKLRQPKELSINKVGHALHDLDRTFDEVSRLPPLADAATRLGIARPLLLQSMYIFKQPHIGGEVVCHQDATFLHTTPLSVVGFWLALEDATIDNGCLWAAPGGHLGPLRARFIRDGLATRMETLDPTPLPDDGLVPLEAPKGTLVVLHGLLPHRSGANRSASSRHAYALHVIDGTTHYSPDNWLRRRPERPLRGFAAA